MQVKMTEAYTHEQNTGAIRLLQKNRFTQGTPQKAVPGNRIYFFQDENNERMT